MSHRNSLKLVGVATLAIAGVFGFFLASQIVELSRIFRDWTVKENYVTDVFNVCRGLLWVLGAHWCYQTFRSGLDLFTGNIEGTAHVVPKQQQQPNQNGNGKQQQHPNRDQHQQGGGQQQGQQHGQQNRVQQLQQQK